MTANMSETGGFEWRVVPELEATADMGDGPRPSRPSSIRLTGGEDASRSYAHKPRLLDLFCGAGGAAMGYHRAGFDVIGVDIDPQPHYPFEFWHCDALDLLNDPLLVSDWARLSDCFDVIHASPPCQRWMGVPSAKGEDYPDLLSPTRELLRATGLPYVIENIPTAPLDGPVFCGVSFGLPVVRHRRFETSIPLALVPSACPQRSFQRSTDHPGTYPFAHGAWRPAWRERVMPVLWPWMTLEETHDAIPAAYTEWIGGQLIAALGLAA